MRPLPSTCAARPSQSWVWPMRSSAVLASAMSSSSAGGVAAPLGGAVAEDQGVVAGAEQELEQGGLPGVGRRRLGVRGVGRRVAGKLVLLVEQPPRRGDAHLAAAGVVEPVDCTFETVAAWRTLARPTRSCPAGPPVEVRARVAEACRLFAVVDAAPAAVGCARRARRPCWSWRASGTASAARRRRCARATRHLAAPRLAHVAYGIAMKVLLGLRSTPPCASNARPAARPLITWTPFSRSAGTRS